MPSSRYSRYPPEDEDTVRRSRTSDFDAPYSRSSRYQEDDNAVVRRSRTQDFDRPSSRSSRYQGDDDAIVRRSRTQDFGGYGDDDEIRYSRNTVRRYRWADDQDAYNERRRDRYGDYEDGYNSRRSRRGDSAPGYNDYENGSGRRSRSNREVQSPGDQQNQQVARHRGQRQQQESRDQNDDDNNEDDDDEEEDDFMTKNFDHGFDGVLTSAAGAAIGAITARHFGGPSDFTKAAETKKAKARKNWKMIGGAVVGAVAFNVGQTRLKSYLEEERKEDVETHGELLGEVVGAVGPDVL